MKSQGWLIVVSLIALAGMTVSCADSTPETPGNAVMDYITAAQLDHDDEAEGRLCQRLRQGASPEELAMIDRIVNQASVFGEGVVQEDDDSAVVRLEVLFAPSPRGAQGDPWEAHLVKEDDRWKVCGFEPIAS